MTVIAIDTSSRITALLMRVTPQGGVLAVREVAGGHLDEQLPSAMAGLLGGEVSAVVVLTGPGSYTGVRAGMAAALGLATACNVPLHGMGTLNAIAAAVRTDIAGPLLAVADAGRGGVYAAHFPMQEGVLALVNDGAVRRTTGADLETVGFQVVATAPVPGLRAHLVSPRTALAAAVPEALRACPLAVTGLSATQT